MNTIRRQSSVASLLLVVVWLVFASLACSQEYPQPKGYVNDFANLLSSSEVDSLNAELLDFRSKTSIEIAVVTVTSLQGLTVEDYTNGLANAWGVGKKDKDNGVVLLLAPAEKKVRIEVGRGLEEVLTDLHSSRIIREDIKPLYRQHPNQAIIAGTHAIMRHLLAKQNGLASAATEQSVGHTQEQMSPVVLVVMCLLCVGFIVFIVMIVRSIRDSDSESRRVEPLVGVAYIPSILASTSPPTVSPSTTDDSDTEESRPSRYSPDFVHHDNDRHNDGGGISLGGDFGGGSFGGGGASGDL